MDNQLGQSNVSSKVTTKANEISRQGNIQNSKSLTSILGNRKALIIVLIVVFLLCCASSATVAGVLYLRNRDNSEGADDSDNGDNSDGDNKNKDGENDEDNGDNQDGEDDNDGDNQGGEDDNDGDDQDNDGDSQSQPDLDEVLSNMQGISSYKLYVDMIEEGGNIEAWYKAPNREYVNADMDGIVIEEIIIGSQVWERIEGEAWEEIEGSSLTGFNEGIMEVFEEEDIVIKKAGKKDGNWYYNVSYEAGKLDLYVSRETNHFVKFVIYEDGDLIGTMEYSDINSDTIKIEKPI